MTRAWEAQAAAHQSDYLKGPDNGALAACKHLYLYAAGSAARIVDRRPHERVRCTHSCSSVETVLALTLYLRIRAGVETVLVSIRGRLG